MAQQGPSPSVWINRISELTEPELSELHALYIDIYNLNPWPILSPM